MLDSNSSNMLLNSQVEKAAITIELIRVKVLISFLAIGLLIMTTDY